MLIKFFVQVIFLVFGVNYSFFTYAESPVILENQNFKIKVERMTGSISSFLIKKNNTDLISERRLMANFRICIQTDGNLSNYIDGMQQKARSVTKDQNTIAVTFSGMTSPTGVYKIELTYWIRLQEDFVSFNAKLTNNEAYPVAEFWFPRVGGWKEFGNNEAKLAIPGYNVDCQNDIPLFENFPGRRGLGAEAAEFSSDYPGMVMPWWSVYDKKSNLGLYLGYHDTTCRYSTWHTYLIPDVSEGERGTFLTDEQAKGNPVGLIYSHVFYPFCHSGETFNSGEFIIRVHNGDWHNGSQFYREWFMTHFPFDKSKSWLRKQSSWFTSIIYQPEDKVVTNYEGYNQWTKDAKKYGISCYELIGWDSGGLERNYPIYIPEEKLGGTNGFKNLLSDIKSRGDHCLVFVNYNILDQNTDLYKKSLNKYMAQDQFGKQPIWMAWGESTLLARKGLSVRHHIRSSVVPEIENILTEYLIRLVEDGAQGFQIDKLVVGSSLDFNPLNTAKPDVALCEGLVQAIGRLSERCKTIDPDFNMASEVALDRFLPYFDIGYRSTTGYQISPLHYVFPEWTSCQHISAPRDFKGVNGAAMTGSVICVEPESYQGSLNQPLYHDLAAYIQEVERLREKLADIIFLGKYFDNQHGQVIEVNNKLSNDLHYKVWGDPNTDKRALVITNDSPTPVKYKWSFEGKDVKRALLYAPFKQVKNIKEGGVLTIEGTGLNIIIEE